MSSITIVSMTPQFEASLTDDYRVVIYDRNMFIVQATALLRESGGNAATYTHKELKFLLQNFVFETL
jgi:hypothetical protein